MLPAVLALAVASATLDPVEVATRHEKAGRPNLALHLLDRLTGGKGDAAAQQLRAHLLLKCGYAVGSHAAPSAAPSAAPAPAPADPRVLFERHDLPGLEARLASNPRDFQTFMYLTKAHWQDAQRLLTGGNRPGALRAFDEGRAIEQRYLANFDELTGSTAPDGLAAQLGR